MQIGLILLRVELDRSLCKTEDYFNEMPGVLAVFDLNEALHLVLSLGVRLPDAGVTPPAPHFGGAGGLERCGYRASGFQRDQTSHHYRNQAIYLQLPKIIILIYVNLVTTKDVH